MFAICYLCLVVLYLDCFVCFSLWCFVDLSAGFELFWSCFDLF